MADTITTILNGINITSASQYNASIKRIDLSTYVGKTINFHAKVYNYASAANTRPNPGAKIKVYYNFSVTQVGVADDDAVIPPYLGSSSESFEVNVSSTSGGYTYFSTTDIPRKGIYLYVWLSHDVLGAAVTFTLSCSEKPVSKEALDADNAVPVYDTSPKYIGGIAVDPASPTTYALGDRVGAQFDLNTGALMVNPGIPSSTMVTSSAYASSLVVKASAGTLVYCSGYSSLGSAQWIQVHNATSLPANTAVPKFIIPVAATSGFSFWIPLTGAYFGTGITVCNSTTGPTLTVGASDTWFQAVVI